MEEILSTNTKGVKSQKNIKIYKKFLKINDYFNEYLNQELDEHIFEIIFNLNFINVFI